MPDKTVTLDDQEWQQLVAIIANATGFMTFQKLLGQLQAQDGTQPDVGSAVVKGDGLDPDPPADQLALGGRRAREAGSAR